MKHSESMIKTLRSLIRAYDEAVAQELATWGKAGADRVAKKGVSVAGYSQRTIDALERHGAITTRIVTHEGQSGPLRRGHFGAWIGGAHPARATVNRFAIPTENGRKAAGARAGQGRYRE